LKALCQLSLAIEEEVDDPIPDHRLEISRPQELLKEKARATRQSSWHWRGKPRASPQAPKPVMA
jgi:hypothetical protein